MAEDAALALAHDALARGAFAAAEEQCRAALGRDPKSAPAMTLLGRIYVDSGALFPGIALLERARSLAESDHTVLLALAEALEAAGEASEAESILRRAVEVAPGSRSTWIALGRHLQFSGRHTAAVATLRHAVALGDDNPIALLALSGGLFAAGMTEEARASFDRAIEQRPALASGVISLAQVAERRGQHERAVATLDHAVAMRPGDPELAYARDAVTGMTSHDRAPAEYVAAHFDGFASVFDTRLRDDLRYTVPETLVTLLERERELARGAGGLDILDAGCGTGLCGPLLRPLARRLIGVDLSGEMLKLADRRGVYDELIAAELVDVLRASPGAYDVIVAADVLAYFGALDALVSAVRDALRAPGLFAASIESHDGDGYALGPSGRWAHGADELRRAGAACGLVELAREPTELRMEFGAPVAGFVTVLARGVD